MMTKIHATGLFVSLWAALVLSAMARALATGDFTSALIGTLFWAAVQGAGLTYACTRDKPPAKQVTDGIAAIGMLAWVMELMVDSILPASMSLLLWLQAARNPALATRRDVYFALGISLTLMMFGAAEARSGAFLGLMTAYAFTVLAVLVYCHQQTGFEQEMLVQRLAKSGIPASLPLRHIALLSGGVFVVALGLYLLVPRPDPLHVGVVPSYGGEKYSHSEWEREARNGTSDIIPADASAKHPQRQSNAGRKRNQPTQSDDTLDITKNNGGGSGAGDRHGGNSANGIVMYVKADRSLYLRGRTYDRFEHDRWHDTQHETRKLLPYEGRFELPNPGRGTEVEYVVQVVSPIGSALPLSAHASTLKAPAGVIAQNRSGTVFLAADIDPGFHYSATSLLPTNYDRPIAYDASFNPSHYLQLPDEFSPRISLLARQVSALADSPLARAMALETHLRTSYAYSFETVFTSQNVTPLESFLFDTRRGHCEFFASAMAAMLRTIGIPSRVVHGFLAHTFNPVTGFYEVRRFDGHAWVEAYIEGAGWMTFEPTAAYPVPQRQQQTGTALFDLKAYTEQLAEQERLQGKSGLLPSIAALFSRAAELWHLLMLQLQLWFDVARAWFAAHYLQLAILVAGTCAAAMLAYRSRIHLLWWWARIMVRAAPAARVPLAAFRQLERVARARQLGRHASETVDDYLHRLERAHAGLQKELTLLRRAFNAVRYGDRKLTREEEAIVLQAFHNIGAARTNAG